MALTARLAWRKDRRRRATDAQHRLAGIARSIEGSVRGGRYKDDGVPAQLPTARSSHQDWTLRFIQNLVTTGNESERSPVLTQETFQSFIRIWRRA
jgi:hypothetical protein